MTPQEAVDEMCAVFQVAWTDTGYTAIWDDLPGSVPKTQDAWARVTVQHNNGGQETLGAIGSRYFKQTGFVTVQIFAPVGDGRTEGLLLANVVIRAYSRAHGTVWYSNPRIVDAGTDGAFTQTNVLINFSYSDLR